MENLSELTAVVLAGGFGTRLRSIVTDRPKVLAEINGKAFLTYILDQLADAGFRKVVLCTGHLGEHIQAKISEKYRSLCILYSHESSPLGTGGALSLALPYLKSSDVLVTNGDSYCSTDFVDLWAWHQKKEAAATLLLTHLDDTSRYGRVSTGADDTIIGFDEKNGSEKPGWINAGIYLIRRHLLAEIPKNQFVSLEREIFPSWSSRGLYGYRTHSRFIDIGTPESYAKATSFFSSLNY